LAAAGLALLAVAGVALIRLEPWDPRMLASGFFRTRRVTDESYRGSDAMLERRWRTAVMLSYEDDPTTSVAVAENTLPDGRHYRSLLVNGKADGATQGDNNTTGLLALLPALFSQLPERAFVVGYGTGHTAGELAALSANREVVVAEISSGVIRAAPLFDFASLDASSNPKIRIQRGDAYRALLRSSGRFDVIVSEPSNPWVTGVEMLYSLEFLTAARERLSPGGVFAQWLHQYESDREMLSLVLRTYAAVFDHVAVWYGGGRDLILLGFKDDRAALDVTGLAWRASQPDFAAGLARAEIEDFPQLLAHELLPLGVVHAADLEGPLHSLYRPLLNALGARAFFRAAVGELPFTGFGQPAQVGASHSLLSRYEAAAGGELPATVRQLVVAESCRHRTRQCTALLADWSRATTGADLYAQTLNQALRQTPRLGGRIDASELSRLNALLADAPGDGRSLTPEAAERLTRLVVEYYQHAAPVDRERVLSIWDRCRPDSPRDARCDQGLAHARALFTQGPD
jgi:spermidine synthase